MACSFAPGERQPRRLERQDPQVTFGKPGHATSSDSQGPGYRRTYPTSRPVPPGTSDVRSPVVTLYHFRYLSFLTDYGLDDGFVAACHGVAARIAPHAGLIDVTHLIPPGDIRRGAAVLAQTLPYLPPAVHVAVVDPGVGTARRGIAVEAGTSIFVGPDNGLLSWAVAAAGGAARAFSLTNRTL